MLEGQANILLYDAPGLGDAQFQRALREGTLDKLLGKLPVAQRGGGRNLVLHWFAAYNLYEVSGIDITDPLDSGHGGSPPCGYWHLINLNMDTSTPSYQEGSQIYSGNIHQVPNSANTGSGSKLFIDGKVEAQYFACDPLARGREEVICRTRWLWLPSEGVASNINSLAFHFGQQYNQSGGLNRIFAARLRIKNSAGTPITINKTANQVLLVEYNIRLVSV